MASKTTAKVCPEEEGIERKRSLSYAKKSRRITKAATEMAYPMWVVSVKTVLSGEFTRFVDHHELLRRGLLVQASPDMFGRIIFVSHQWCSFDDPDPLGEQFAAMKEMLMRLSSGKIRRVKTTQFAQEYMAENTVVEASEWRELLPQMFIWMDWMSIPQPDLEETRSSVTGKWNSLKNDSSFHGAPAAIAAEGTASTVTPKTIAQLREDQANAITSIPAYVEQSTLMILLVPVVEHKDISGAICGYDTWRNRGWCRLEMMAAHLSRNDIRLLVVRGGKSRLRFSGTHEVLTLPTLEGDFACCERGHVSKAGTVISCDKPKVSQILQEMIQAKIDDTSSVHDRSKKACQRTSQLERRYYMCVKNWFSRDSQRQKGSFTLVNENLPKANDERPAEGPAPSPADMFAKNIGWGREDEEAGARTGFSLLAFSVIANDYAAVAELLERKEYRAVVNLKIRESHPSICTAKGVTPLILAMIYASWDTVQALLDAGALPSVVDDLGRNGLIWAATQTRTQMVSSWLERVGTQDIELKYNSGVTAVVSSCHISTHALEITQILYQAGAKLSGSVKGLSFNALIAASTSDGLTAELVRYLTNLDEIDVNTGVVAVTRRMKALVRIAKIWRRSGLKLPRAMKSLLRNHAATPLHYASGRGMGNATAALIAAGADPSKRNSLGQNPLQSAEATYGKGCVPRAIVKLLESAS